MDAPIERIVSGGQTGADRAALDVAIAHHIPHGGWCPLGRRAEDGTIDPRYRLKETPTAEYAERTERNVVDSDGTAIFSTGPELGGGTKRTAEFAEAHGKPWIVLHRNRAADPVGRLLEFVRHHGIATLNVAGPRASEEPAIYQFVSETLAKFLARKR